MKTRTLLMTVAVVLAGSNLADVAQARGYRSNSYGGVYGPGVSGGYLSPRGPSSKANQYRVPFYMRADRRVLGLFP